MSLSSDNFTALIHLRDQARKWKNITFITAILVFVILVKVVISGPVSENELIEEVDYIAKINIEGIILKNDHRSKILKKVADQENIKAVIINISSPGGGIVGSEVLHREILKISEKKPVVAVLGAVAASGGYMAAIGADHIIAHNGTLTGSIGVIMQSTEFTNMADKLGVKFQNYKSSHLKGTPSPFEKTDTIVDSVVQESVDDSHEFFVDMVLDRRKGKIKKSNIKKATDGRVVNGRQAKKLGLVDEVGSYDQAVEYLVQKRGISEDMEVKVVSLKKLEEKLIDKILRRDSISNFINGNLDNKRLMAIW